MHEKVQAGQHLSLGCGSSVRKEHLEEEVKSVGFNEDQMASEITRCSSAEEGEAEEPFEWEGLKAEEVLW